MNTIELTDEAVRLWAKTSNHVFAVMRAFEKEVVIACRKIVEEKKIKE